MIDADNADKQQKQHETNSSQHEHNGYSSQMPITESLRNARQQGIAVYAEEEPSVYLSTIITKTQAVFPLSDESNRFSATGRQIDSSDGRGFESAISHFRQSTVNCDAKSFLYPSPCAYPCPYRPYTEQSETCVKPEDTHTNRKKQVYDILTNNLSDKSTRQKTVIKNKSIDYGNIWDATKGYRGEGPAPPKQKQPKKLTATKIADGEKKKRHRFVSKTTRVDHKWAGRLGQWGEQAVRDIGDLMVSGDNLFIAGECEIFVLYE